MRVSFCSPRAALAALVIMSLSACSDGALAPPADGTPAGEWPADAVQLGYGSAIDLGLLPGDDFGSHAAALNDRGEVVGRSWHITAPGVELGRAFLWTPDGPNAGTGSMQVLLMPAGIPMVSDVFDINDRGVAVGWSGGPLGPGPFAAMWVDGMAVTLPGPRAVAINNRGDVVLQDGVNVSLWVPDGEGSVTGTTYPLGSFRAYAINDRREVVGTTSGVGHAQVWRPDAPGATTGTLSDLGSLGGASSVALDINNRGEIVGYSETAGSSQPHAFLWRPDDPRATSGGMIDLNPSLGATAAFASGINEKGDVAGHGALAQGPQGAGAYVWVWRADSRREATGSLIMQALVQPSVLPHFKPGPDINDRGDVAFGVNGHATLWRK